MKNKEGLKIVNNMIIADLKEMKYDAREITGFKNGVEFLGISIREKGDSFGTVVYTKELIEEAARNNTSLKEIVKETVKIHKLSKEKYLKDRVDISELSNREFVIPRLKVRLQKKSNETILKRSYMDMEKILVVDMDKYSAKVTMEFLKHTGITEEEAWVNGEINTFAETEIISLNEMMSKLLGITLEEYHMFYPFTPFYIVTNKTNFHGASAILNKSALNNLRIKFNTNKFIVCPSSIHECIVSPYSEDVSVEEVSKIVKEINTNEIKEEDRLSDNAFVLEL